MFRQLSIASGSALFFGFCFGVFLYLNGGNVVPSQSAMVAESVSDKAVTAEVSERSDYEVIGYVYGGCERTGCPSYRIKSDGSYSYIAFDGVSNNVRHDELLSDRQFRIFSTLFADTNFDALINQPFLGACPTVYDGISYRYEVRMGDVRYSFDACENALEHVPLFIFLKDQFELFRIAHRAY